MRHPVRRVELIGVCLVVGLAVVGCSIAPVLVTEAPNQRTASPAISLAPVVGEIEAVSRSKPSAEAIEALNKCLVDQQTDLDKVSGMGKVASAKDVLHYVPLTGREPQLQDQGPAWIVQIRGDVPQPRGELWTNPTCVVTASDHGFYATGPVTNANTGTVTMPEAPATPPDRTLPTFAPQQIATRMVALAAEHARAARCEQLHADFDDELRAFQLDSCGFVPTPLRA